MSRSRDDAQGAAGYPAVPRVADAVANPIAFAAWLTVRATARRFGEPIDAKIYGRDEEHLPALKAAIDHMLADMIIYGALSFGALGAGLGYLAADIASPIVTMLSLAVAYTLAFVPPAAMLTLALWHLRYRSRRRRHVVRKLDRAHADTLMRRGSRIAWLASIAAGCLLASITISAQH